MVSTAALALVDHPSDREIRFTRTVDAPIDLVWSIWSDPVHLHRWFGPTGFQNTTQVFDFRVGGEWRFTMHAPDGRDNPNRIRFTEILPPTRLVYENTWNSPGKELDFTVAWSFRAESPKRTRIEIVMTYTDAAALKVAVEHYGVNPGGPQTLERVARQLERLGEPSVDTSDREIVTVRVVQAPRELVWKVWTDPDQWQQWWGPKGFTNSMKVMEVRSGGRWEFTMHGPDGTDYRNDARYLQVIAPQYLEWVHESTPKFSAIATFEELGGSTRVTLRSILDSAEDYKRAVEVFHAVQGAKETIDRLEALVALPPAIKQLNLVRVVQTSPERTWRAWTDPAQLSKWFCPDGFTVSYCKLDVRPEGLWALTMRDPGGDDSEIIGEHLEVVPHERLVLRVWVVGPEGRPALVEHATVLFQPAGRGTRVTVYARIIEMSEAGRPMVEGMDSGWQQTIDHLVTYLDG